MGEDVNPPLFGHQASSWGLPQAVGLVGKLREEGNGDVWGEKPEVIHRCTVVFGSAGRRLPGTGGGQRCFRGIRRFPPDFRRRESPLSSRGVAKVAAVETEFEFLPLPFTCFFSENDVSHFSKCHKK
jgi:hypothetical protein